MVSACRDTAGFTLFGFNMGWFGIAYFSLLLIVLWFCNRDSRLDSLFSVLVFSGAGAELRLLWIQKFIIGGWCPLCVSICCALFIVSLLLVVEKSRQSGECRMQQFTGWLALMLVVAVIGLAIAIVGVKQLI
jgi:hypothetical protein